MKENRTVNRIMAMLELISRHPEGLTLGQIFRMLDIPKATAYDFLQTLYAADAIYYKNPRLKTYVIGSKMFAIGSVYNKNSNLIEAAQFDLTHFADFYGYTVFITKRINDNIIYIFKHQPKNSRVLMPEEIGTIIHDFTTSAPGQCYLAFDHLLNGPKLPNIDVIKGQQYIISNDLDNPGITTLAVPVYNFENRVVGVLVASNFIQSEFDPKLVIHSLVTIAQQTSQKLGYIRPIK
jgi:IclR family transcriptional regulator, KDG regulon repressor